MTSRPEKTEKSKIFKISKLEVFGVFHKRSSYFHEPGVGTDTSGPGEAVFTTRRGKFKGVT